MVKGCLTAVEKAEQTTIRLVLRIAHSANKYTLGNFVDLSTRLALKSGDEHHGVSRHPQKGNQLAWAKTATRACCY